jgi:DNA-formamidopyrimidine glycosylase
MPELPEVETIVRGLRRTIVGKTIGGVEVRLARSVIAPAGVTFDRAVAGERISGVGRRGKYAIIELASGGSLVTSLRMTGRLIVAANGAPEWPGTHVILNFTDGARLRFSDVRTFGRMRLVRPGEAWDRELGVEPLSPGFTDQGSTPRSAAHRGHRQYLCVRGAVGSSDSSGSARREPDETGDAPLTSGDRRRSPARDRNARDER